MSTGSKPESVRPPTPDTDEQRFRQLFDGTPLPMFVEDFSAVKPELDALRARQPHLRAYFAAHPDETLRLASLVRVVDVNQAAVRFFRAESPAQVPRQIQLHFDRDATVVFGDELAALARGETQFHCEMPLVYEDGERRILDVRVTVGAGHEETMDLVYVVFADSTAAKKSREELVNSERRYRSLIESSADGVLLHENGAIIFANHALLAMMGIQDASQLIGRSLLDYVHPEYRELAVQRMVAAMRDGYTPVQDFKLLRADGTALETEVNSRRVQQAGQDCIQVTIRDITGRRQAEGLQARLAMVVEQATESVVITDPVGRIVYVNPACERISGYDRSELLGQNPRLLQSGRHPPSFYREMWVQLEKGLAWHGTFVNRHKNGTLYDEEATISPVRDRHGAVIYYVAVKRDVTKERQIEEQLRQAQKMEAVGSLAGGVAHDFNNILTAMLMNLSFLEGNPTLDMEALGTVRELMREAQRAAALTRQLLMYSRRSVLQTSQLDLNEVVAGLLKMLHRLIGENIQLVFDSCQGLPIIEADAGMVEQILMNLVVNARDAMPRGGRLTVATNIVTVSDDTPAEVHGRHPGKFAVLRVSDTGTGIEEQLRKRIFDPFFTTKPAGSGTGLGLATVQGIVYQHKGLIELDTEVGRGSTFSIYLPLARDTLGDSTRRVGEDAPCSGTETILLVEDEASVRNVLTQALQALGYRVIAASRAEEALSLWQLHASSIDLLFTDQILPGQTTGLELSEILRQRKPSLVVIVSSGYSEELVRLEASQMKKIRYLPKPVSAYQLAAAVRRALDDRAGRASPDGASQ